MAIDCCSNSGGRVSLNLGGLNVTLRGKVTIKPTTIEKDVVSNTDGSIAVMVKPVPAECEITVSDRCGLTMDQLMGCSIDATIRLIDVQRTYLFTKAIVTGRPSLDGETGEITGLKIVTSQVTQI